tara:strand:- start:60 stop:281 length:222 start_codon:yes stop_codon:yes gene_type:complete
MQAFICRYDKNENLHEICQFSISYPGIFPTASGKNGLYVTVSKSTVLEGHSKYKIQNWHETKLQGRQVNKAHV